MKNQHIEDKTISLVDNYYTIGINNEKLLESNIKNHIDFLIISLFHI